MKLNITKLAAAIGICLMAGVIGGFFTTPAIPTWYATLNKPAESPPSWVFAPVWTTLYILMGLALYLIWEKGYSNKKVKWAMNIFGVQLVLNIFWSVLFFGLRSPYYAFIEILVFGMMILGSFIAFYDIDKRAGIMLVPYILWVSFATVLNYSIWQLNM